VVNLFARIRRTLAYFVRRPVVPSNLEAAEGRDSREVSLHDDTR